MMALPLIEAKCSDGLSVPVQEPKTSVLPNLSSKSSEEGLSVGKPAVQGAPSFMKIISELQSLSTVMQTFHCRWDELQKHIDFVENAVEKREKQLATLPQSHHPNDFGTNIASHGGDIAVLTAKESTGSDVPSSQNQKTEKKDSTPITENSSTSSLESMCRNMASRELRRHMVSHLSEASKLRREVPAVLKNAPNPAELVFQSIGKFYVQGSKAYTKKSMIISFRLAAILTLECFLLMESHDKFEQSVKEEAEQAALAWRKRLITEGGVCNASREDARGLLFLVACFGIPDAFDIDDLINLLRLSDVHNISVALRKSSFLLAKIPDIVKCLKNKGMEVEAVDFVYTFGIDDKLPLKILRPYLNSLNENLKKANSEANGSAYLLKIAYRQHITALKSVIRCLKYHKIDPDKVLSGWKLNDKIAALETEISELNRKMDAKRKRKEEEQTVQTVRVLNDQDYKRPKIPSPSPSPFSSLQEPRAAHDSSVYQLVSKYSDPIYTSPTVPSWSHNYNGFSSRIGLPGSSYGPSFSSGSTLAPDAVPSSAESSFGASFSSGSTLAPNAVPYSAGYSIPSSERSMKQGYIGSREYGSHAYVSSSSSLMFEGFQGVPRASPGAANRSSASDLYNFADAISESDYARTSRGGPGTFPAPNSYRSPYL